MPWFYAAMLVLTAYSVSEQHAANVDARAARRKERAIAAARNLKEQRQALAASRVEAARIQSSAASSGVAGSSGPEGGIGSLTSTTYGNIGFSNQLTALNNQRLSFLGSSAEHQSRASMAGEAAGSIPTFYNFGVQSGAIKQ